MANSTSTRANIPGGLAGFGWLLIVLLPVYYVVIVRREALVVRVGVRDLHRGACRSTVP